MQVILFLVFLTSVVSLQFLTDLPHDHLHSCLDHVTMSMPLSALNAADSILTMKKSLTTELSWWQYIFTNDGNEDSDVYKPARLPLSPLLQADPDDLREYAREVKAILEETVDVLKEGVLPENNEDLVAIFTSEACAGALGGISSQIVSFLLNDKKRQSLFTETVADASFFGIRSVVRTVTTFLGLPQPIVNVAAPIIATLASESAKVEATRRVRNKNAVDNGKAEEMEGKGYECNEQAISCMPFDQDIHGIGQRVLDRRSWLRRKIAISRGQLDGDVGTSDVCDYFGKIVDIVYSDDDGQVKSVLCQWEGTILYKVDVDNRAWMKASDVWVVRSMTIKAKEEVENSFDVDYVLNQEKGTIMSMQNDSNIATLTTRMSSSMITMKKDKTSLISFPEIAQDVAKWVSYNLLLPADERLNYLRVGEYGLLAGVIGCFFFEITKSKQKEKKILNGSNDDVNKVDKDIEPIESDDKVEEDIENNSAFISLFSRFMNAGLEGAALFVAYEGSLQLLDINSDIRLNLVDKTKRIPFVPYSD